MSDRSLKQALIANKRILPSGNNFSTAVLDFSFVQDNPFFHAQEDRHLMGFPTPSLFTPSEHLIGGSRVDTVLARERLN